MLVAWIVATALLLFTCLIISGAMYADGETKASAVAGALALLSWTWPVTVPMAALFGLVNFVFFIIETLTHDRHGRPEWWPL